MLRKSDIRIDISACSVNTRLQKNVLMLYVAISNNLSTDSSVNFVRIVKHLARQSVKKKDLVGPENSLLKLNDLNPFHSSFEQISVVQHA